MKILAVLFDILWARRAIVLIATIASLGGGLAVVVTGAPRYVATARVVLDYIKPDPVTGARVDRKQVDAYVNSQMQFIHDYQVAVPAAEALGLMDNPDLVDAYNAISGEKPEYPMWVAQQVLSTLTVAPYQDTNILEIRYRARDRRTAEDVAEAVRAAYIDATVATRRQGAESSATQLTQQLEKVKGQLAKVHEQQTQLERESGVIFGKRDIDLDTRTLVALSTYQQKIRSAGVAATPAKSRAATIDAEIAEASSVLGPNNPRLQALIAQQKTFKEEAAKTASLTAQTAQATAAAARETQVRAEQYKSKVLGQRSTLLQLQLQQDLIDGYTEQINTLTDNINAARQTAAAQVTSITPIGPATSKPQPSFPNPPLILGGSGVLGFALGALLALLCEMFARRVRNTGALVRATEAPLLAVVPRAAAPRAPRSGRLTWRFVSLGRKQAA